MTIALKQLSECPEHLKSVGLWIYEQWWHKRCDSPEVVFSWLRTHSKLDTVPYSVIALAEDEPVGSCCVIENDCIHRPQYAPWVAAVYVKPDFRRRGIASMILNEAAAVAARARVKGLFIDCLAVTASVYEKNGWSILEREVGDKESVVMLRKIELSIRLEVGDGFYLSPIVRTDKAAYLEHFADPEIARNLLAIPFPYTEADADWWLDRCEQSVGSPTMNFALRAPSGYLIGAIGLVGEVSTGVDSAEFGYWLAQSYRGRGLMPRVICTFSDYAFQQLRLHRLFATPFASNLASQRVLEKAGFKREGLLKHHHLKQGVYLDAILYGRISDSNRNA